MFSKRFFLVCYVAIAVLGGCALWQQFAADDPDPVIVQPRPLAGMDPSDLPRTAEATPGSAIPSTASTAPYDSTSTENLAALRERVADLRTQTASQAETARNSGDPYAGVLTQWVESLDSASAALQLAEERAQPPPVGAGGDTPVTEALGPLSVLVGPWGVAGLALIGTAEREWRRRQERQRVDRADARTRRTLAGVKSIVASIAAMRRKIVAERMPADAASTDNEIKKVLAENQNSVAEHLVRWARGEEEQPLPRSLVESPLGIAEDA